MAPDSVSMAACPPCDASTAKVLGIFPSVAAQRHLISEMLPEQCDEWQDGRLRLSQQTVAWAQPRDADAAGQSAHGEPHGVAQGRHRGNVTTTLPVRLDPCARRTAADWTARDVARRVVTKAKLDRCNAVQVLRITMHHCWPEIGARRVL